MSNDNHYIKAADFTQFIKDFYKYDDELNQWQGDTDCKEYRKLVRLRKKAIDKCGLAIYKVCLGLNNHGKFSGYTWKDDMLGDALTKCTKALLNRKFDPNRGFNPFSYFNMIANHEFVHRIKVEKKHFEMVTKYGEEHLRDFAEDCDEDIYVKPNFTSKLGEFYDETMEISVEE